MSNALSINLKSTGSSLVDAAMAVPENAITKGAGIKALDQIEAWAAKHAAAAAMVADAVTVRDAATSEISAVLVKNFTLHQPAIELAIATIKDADNEGAKARQQAANDMIKVMLDMVRVQVEPSTGKRLYVETDAVKKRFGVGAIPNSQEAKRGVEAKRNFATFLKKATTQALGILNDGFTGKDVSIDPTTKHILLSGPNVKEVYGVNRDSILLNGKTPEGVTHNLKHENSLKATRERAIAAYTPKAAAPAVTPEGGTHDALAGSNINQSIQELCPRMITLLNGVKDIAIADDTLVQLRALQKVIDEFHVWKREQDNVFAEATARQAKVAGGPKPTTKAAKKSS